MDTTMHRHIQLQRLQALVDWAKVEMKSTSMAIDSDCLADWLREGESLLRFPNIEPKGTMLRDLDQCVEELTKLRRLAV